MAECFPLHSLYWKFISTYFGRLDWLKIWNTYICKLDDIVITVGKKIVQSAKSQIGTKSHCFYDVRMLFFSHSVSVLFTTQGHLLKQLLISRKVTVGILSIYFILRVKNNVL